MRLFNENLILNRMEQILSEQLTQVKIIGDIPLSRNDFEYLAEKIRVFIQNGVENELFNKYRASIATFLVFGAVYYYDGGTYWPNIEKYTGDIQTNRRNDFYKRFIYILEHLNLPRFEKEQEEGFRYVTPILCHAGIPQSCLDDYFEVVSDTLNNTAFFEGHILEEFKYFMRFKVQKPVIRYFEFLENEAEEFLQNSRDLLLYIDGSNSSVEDAKIKFQDLPKRMIERCFEWQNSERVKDKIKIIKNVILTSPKIMLDTQGMGIYVLLPQQLIRDCFDDKVSWEIIYGERVFISKARLFKKGEFFVSEEKTVSLLPNENYKISLFIEDKPVGTWEFKGLSDGYICFDRKGNLIRKAHLPPDVVVVIFDKKQDLGYNNVMIEELTYFPNWINYKTYRINLENARQLVCSFGSVEVKKDNKLTLIGGKTLFDQTDGVGAICFTSLPNFLLNDGSAEKWHITVSFKHEKQEIHSMSYILTEGMEKHSLHDYIERYAFGEYDITVWNERKSGAFLY